jgi:hypothetical protein
MIDMHLTLFVRRTTRISRPFEIGDCSPSPTVVFLMEVSPDEVNVLILVKCDVEGRVYAGCGDGIHVWSKFCVL